MSQRLRRFLMALSATVSVLAILAVTLFLLARNENNSEWQHLLEHRTPEARRGIIDALTRFSNEPANFMPLSALDDEMCSLAVVGAANFVIGEDKLNVAPAWLLEKSNPGVLTRIYDRSSDFAVLAGVIKETKDSGFQLSKILSDPEGLYIVGYLYHDTHSTDKIIAAEGTLNSHLMLLLGRDADKRMLGYHLIHYPTDAPGSNPVHVERVDKMPEFLDLIYVWQVSGVKVAKEGQKLFLANTTLPYTKVRRWINLSPIGEYYVDTVSVWLMNKVFGTGQYPLVLDLGDKPVVEVPRNGHLFHGQVMGFYNGLPIYYHGGQSERGQFGLEFQCVELVNRHLASLGHTNLSKTGHADSYLWEAESKGLVGYPNGNKEKPRADDLLIFDQSNSDSNPGHIAVIYLVLNDLVCFVQQNAEDVWQDCLPLQGGDSWSIVVPPEKADFYRGPVAGWSRVKK